MRKRKKPDARERILRAASGLLADGGRSAVTTRAVSAAAGVQAPTIYRQFGDMGGLLDAAACETLAAHVRVQATRAPSDDPMEDLRRGWDLYVAFGLANPDAFALIYAGPLAAVSPSVEEGYAVLRALVARIAEVGRLRVSVDRAVRALDAAALGVTLTLAAGTAKQRTHSLSETVREAILAAITTADSSNALARAARAQSVGERVAAHAVALRALLPQASDTLSPSERQLLVDWLDRLVAAIDGGQSPASVLAVTTASARSTATAAPRSPDRSRRAEHRRRPRS
jgi:AcrR family transcriptional regulator